MKQLHILLRNKATGLWFAFLMLVPAYLLNGQEGWERMTDMDMGLVYPKSAVINENIYIYGGFMEGPDFSASCKQYNTTNDTWQSLSNIDSKLFGNAIEQIGNKVYLFGGATDFANFCSTTRIHDIEKDEWTNGCDIPVISLHNPSCTYLNYIYLFGGTQETMTPSPTCKKVYCFDAVEDRWDSISDMRFEHYNGLAFEINGKLYITGGHGWSNNKCIVHGQTEIYDIKSKEWSLGDTMLLPLTNLAGITYLDKIFIFGGDKKFGRTGGGDPVNTIQEYDPLTNKWRFMKEMPFKRADMTMERVGKYAYLFGGTDNVFLSSSVLKEVWRVNLDSLGLTPINNPTTSSKIFLQGYPNPFTESTTIKYKVNSPGPVTIDIYDCLGQHVANLVNENQAPGTYTVMWKRENLRAGIYYCKINSGKNSNLLKLVAR